LDDLDCGGEDELETDARHVDMMEEHDVDVNVDEEEKEEEDDARRRDLKSTMQSNILGHNLRG